MSKVIATEIIELDGTDTAKTILPLTREILDSSAGGQPSRAFITVRGAVVFVNRDGADPAVATGNYEAFGNNGRIVVEGYDNMAAIKFGQLTQLTAKLYVTYEN